MSAGAVVIGASAGALEAITILLTALPVNYPRPVIAVVHLPADKTNLIPELLRDRCKIDVCEAEDKEALVPGRAYFAPPDYHLLIEHNYSLALSRDEPVMFSRPSIDVLFESAADAYGENLIAVVLTGANSDGAIGARTIQKAGGTIIVQDPATAHAKMMPQEAIKACPGAFVLNLQDIAAYLQKLA